MTIVSGISTAPGVAPLLNAPRETNQVQRSQAQTASSEIARLDGVTAGQTDTNRPVLSVVDEANAGRAPEIRTSTDDRYQRFVDAIQVLRTDGEATELDDERVAELFADTDEFFLANDGIPQPVEPLPPDASILVRAPEVEMPLDQIDPLAEASGQSDRGVSAETSAIEARKTSEAPSVDRTTDTDGNDENAFDGNDTSRDAEEVSSANDRNVRDKDASRIAGEPDTRATAKTDRDPVISDPPSVSERRDALEGAAA